MNRRARRSAAALVAGLGLLATACSSGTTDAADTTTSPPPASTSTSVASTATVAPVPTASTTTAPPAPPGTVFKVAIVSDSEIASEVAQALDDRPEIEVVSRELHGGYRMSELDPYVEPAFAQHPDVFLYAGGTNDISRGPLAMLTGLASRLPAYAKRACLVVAVPVFRYERGTPAEVARRTEGTRIIERQVEKLGGHPVSYLDISLDMDRTSEDFFGDGGLGELHPAPQAYPRITRALAEAIARCPARAPS